MDQYTRLLQVPKSYYVERNFPCSKMDCMRLIKKKNKRKKDFVDDVSYKQYVVTEYYKNQIDNIIDQYDGNDDLRVYILEKLMTKINA